MTQAVSRQPVTAEAWVRYRASRCGFVADKVALGQVFPRIFRLSAVSIIPPVLIHLCIARVTEGQQLTAALYLYLRTEVSSSIILFGQAKNSVHDIIDDDDNDDDNDDDGDDDGDDLRT